MKNSIVILFILLFSISCSSEKEEDVLVELSESEISFSADENTKKITIKSNGEWNISDIPDWITLNSTKGSGNEYITINIQKNTSEEGRSTSLTIKTKNDIKSLKIAQNGKNVSLSISKSEITIPAEPLDEEFSFEIISNEPWTIIEIPEWCTLSADKGDGNATVIVKPEKNYDETSREAIIKIKAGSKTELLILKQSDLSIQLEFASVDLSQTYTNTLVGLNFNDESSSKSIMIKSNTKWSAKSNASWCIVEKENGKGAELITVKVQQNLNKTIRNAEIVINTGTKSLKVSVKQKQSIQVTDNLYQINERDNAPQGGDTLINVQTKYVNPGKAGENISWTFNSLTPLKNNYIVYYNESPLIASDYLLLENVFNLDKTSINNLIQRTDQSVSTAYLYQIINGKFVAKGHFNANTSLGYKPDNVADVFPSYYNTTYKSSYQSESLYSTRIKMITSNETEIHADGYGTITLPSGTYKNALRIKYVTRTKYLSIEPGVYDPKDLDSEYTIYKWYVKGYRYPLLETHRIVNIYSNEETFSCAFYCPPAGHKYLTKTNHISSDLLIKNNNGQVAFFKKQHNPNYTFKERIHPILINSKIKR